MGILDGLPNWKETDYGTFTSQVGDIANMLPTEEDEGGWSFVTSAVRQSYNGDQLKSYNIIMKEAEQLINRLNSGLYN